MEVDHKDGIGLNNADANLRVITKSAHHKLTRQRRAANWKTGASLAWAKRRSTSKTGFYGVSVHRHGFMASATVSGQGGMTYLGKFDAAIDAAKKVNEFLKQFDPADPRLNKDPQAGEIL